MRSTNRSTKILITNIVALNPGDAAILWGTIDILRSRYGKNVDIVVYDKTAEVAKRCYPWAQFRQALFAGRSAGRLARALGRIGYGHWINRIRLYRFLLALRLLGGALRSFARAIVTKDELEDLNNYRSADLILSSGGTYLIENYDLEPAILDYRLSNAAGKGKALGFFTQTLGPFTSAKNQRNLRQIFSKASVILLRDERSSQHLRDIGIPKEKITLAADAAFVVAAKAPRPRVRCEESLSSPRVAISVRSMRHFHSQTGDGRHLGYLNAMALAVQVAVEQFGASVTFLSTCQGIPEYWADDASVADQVVAILPRSVRERVEVDRQFRQPWEIVEVYQSFDAVIATRMHAAILAMCAGTPTLGIAYEFKLEELFKSLALPELVLTVAALSENNVREYVARLLSARELYAKRVATAAELMKAQAYLAKFALPDIQTTQLPGQ